jgi:hypothetical protein
VTAAVKGENILMGALKAGLIGGALGGIGAWAAPAAASAGAGATSLGQAATLGSELGLGGTAATGELAATTAGLEGTTAEGAVAAAKTEATLTAAETAGQVGTVTKTGAVAKGTMTTGEKMLMVGSVASGASSMFAPDPADAQQQAFENNRRKYQEGVNPQTPQLSVVDPGRIAAPGWTLEANQQPLPSNKPSVQTPQVATTGMLEDVKNA